MRAHLSKPAYGTTAEQLKAFYVSMAPARNQWVHVGNGVQFCQVNYTILIRFQ